MFKMFLLFLHRWLGLVSGGIVFIVSITGAIFVFEEEIFRLLHPELVYVQTGKQLRTINELREAAQRRLGADKAIDFVFIYGDPARAYCFSAMERNAASTSLWDKDEIEYYHHVYVDPYNARVLGVMNKETEFFYVVRRIHQNLLLRQKTGNLIVGSSVLVFLIILVTGFILWWPKRMGLWKQRCTIKWRARWRRVNYDLHSVLGLYVFMLAFIIAVTGLVWSFDWWEKGIYAMLGSSGKKELSFLSRADTSVVISGDAVTKAWMSTLGAYRKFERISFTFPNKKNTNTTAFVQYKGQSLWTESDYLSFDSKSGALIRQLTHDEKSTGLKWRNSNYNIHTGKIYGLPTQLLALIASLICASLPVTGVVMWWGRRKSKKNGPETSRVSRGNDDLVKLKPVKRFVATHEVE